MLTDRTGEALKAFAAAKRGALAAIGERAKEYARALAPVDTGRLRDGIGCAADADAVRLFAAAPYAPYVEFGTGADPPRPFLEPAVAGHPDEYRAILEDALRGTG
ncbi:MAG: HK97 gp10 family phage protein [Clostridia bacterium]|nr:HK97 gp10 family phage protein [Clostridia bacterium]